MQVIYFTKFLAGKTAEEVGETAKSLGFDGLDLAVRPGQCVNPENVATALPEAVRLWRKMGLAVPLASLETKQTDPRAPQTRQIYEACAEAGVSFIKIGYWTWRPGKDYRAGLEAARQDLAEFDRLSRATGVCTLYHTHSGNYYGCNASAAMRLVRRGDPKGVGVYLDPAHLAINGEPLEMALAIVGDRLRFVAVKNARYTLTHQNGASRFVRDMVPLDMGIVHWPDAIALLRKIGYSGPLSLHGEYDSAEELEAILPLVREDLSLIRRCLGAQAQGAV